jgi:hypothetical protein
MLGNVNAPSLLVTVEDSLVVPRCFAVTVAPGSTPPELSTTRPLMVDVVLPCAYAVPAHSAKVKAAYRPSRSRLRFIEPPSIQNERKWLNLTGDPDASSTTHKEGNRTGALIHPLLNGVC